VIKSEQPSKRSQLYTICAILGLDSGKTLRTKDALTCWMSADLKRKLPAKFHSSILSTNGWESSGMLERVSTEPTGSKWTSDYVATVHSVSVNASLSTQIQRQTKPSVALKTFVWCCGSQPFLFSKTLGEK